MQQLTRHHVTPASPVTNNKALRSSVFEAGPVRGNAVDSQHQYLPISPPVQVPVNIDNQAQLQAELFRAIRRHNEHKITEVLDRGADPSRLDNSRYQQNAFHHLALAGPAWGDDYSYISAAVSDMFAKLTPGQAHAAVLAPDHKGHTPIDLALLKKRPYLVYRIITETLPSFTPEEARKIVVNLVENLESYYKHPKFCKPYIDFVSDYNLVIQLDMLKKSAFLCATRMAKSDAEQILTGDFARSKAENDFFYAPLKKEISEHHGDQIF